MMKNLINFFIAVGFLLPELLGLVVGLLQLLQPKPHTINIGFIRSLIDKLGLEDTPEMPKLWQSVGSEDKNLVLRREAQKRSVETWNWCVC